MPAGTHRRAPRNPAVVSALRAGREHFLGVAPHNHAHWPAIRVGICVSAPLLAVVLLGRPDLAPYAVFGSINSVPGKHIDYRSRLQAQVVTGLALSAAVVVGTAVGAVAPGSMLAVVAMAAFSALGYVISDRTGWLPNPALFLVFAVGTLSSYRHTWHDLIPATLLSLAAALFSVVVGQLGRLRQDNRPRTRPTSATAAHVAPDLALHVAAPALAGIAALVAGLGHPYWAAVTATAPLIGPRYAHRAARGMLRLAGTMAGVMLAALLIHPTTPAWLLCLYVAGLQVLTELFVARNYGIAMIAITPMALIMSYIGGGGRVWYLLRDRMIETLLGVAVALALQAWSSFQRQKASTLRADRPPARR